MTIEANLERIANALEAIAAVAVAGGGAPATKPVATKADDGKKEAEAAAKKEAEAAAKKEAEAAAKKAAAEAAAKKAEDDAAAKKALEEPAKVDGPSKDEVRKALSDFREIEGTARMLEILKDKGKGATNINELKPEHYQAVIDATKAKD